jgi:peptide/nickel transport system substrate-binding protein
LSAFAGAFSVMMISPKALKDHTVSADLAQKWLHDNMVGTGPYLMQQYTQGQSARMTYNPNYWGGWNGPHIRDAVVQYVHEPTTERLLLEQGQADVGLFLPDDTIEQMDGQKGIYVTDVEKSLLAYYLVLPSSKGPTKDKKVRQALSYGFDYQTWCTKTMRGKAIPMHGPIPSSMLGYNPQTPQYTYQPDKAKQLLTEAGYPNGGFNLKYVYETGYAWKRPLGEFFQANMKDLGITVSLQEVSASSYDALLTNPQTAEHVFALVWYPTLATPYDYLFACFATPAQGNAGYNRGYYSNPALDSLLATAVAEPDDTKRTALYGQAQVMLYEDAPALWVYEKHYRLPMRDNLKGFVYNGVLWETLDFYAVHKV